jgi:hypothetical protein
VYDFRVSFVPIRFLLGLWAAFLPFADARSQVDADCTPGWICGKAESHAARRRGADARSQTCAMDHRVLPDDKRPGLFVSMFSSVIPGGGVDFGFSVVVLRIAPDGRSVTEEPLRAIRVFAADRKLDTKAWSATPTPARGAWVRKRVSEDVLPEVRAAIAIASGAAYGIIARTPAGEELRFEIAAGPKQVDIVKEMQACLEARSHALQSR